MSNGVGLDRREAPTGVRVEATVEPVVDTDDYHLPLTEQGQFDEAFGGVIDAPGGLDRVVEGVAEEGSDVH